MAAPVIAILVDLSSRTKFLSRASSSSLASKMGSDSKPRIRLKFSSVTSKAEATHQTTMEPSFGSGQIASRRVVISATGQYDGEGFAFASPCDGNPRSRPVPKLSPLEIDHKSAA